MSWIRAGEATTAPPSGAGAAAFAGMQSLLEALGLDASGTHSMVDHGRALVEDPAPLSAAQVEMIGVVVSATNGCGYCVAHYGPRLAQALGDEGLARTIARDYREANLAARDRVILDYAVALTCEPAERKEEDVERIREYGFDDPAILRVTHLAAYFGMVNRLASGLGVALEPNVHVWEFGDQR